MAGTSLARQLAALRTPGVKSQSATVAYSGPFLFPEASQDHTSVSSLKDAVAENLSLLYSEDAGMSKFTVLLHAETDEPEIDTLITDCLHRLCPHLLLRSAQYVLQWLVTKHNVHIHHPDLLLFITLPHHTYKIYQAVIDCFDEVTLKKIAWLLRFKQNCVPTTQGTLHREVATSTAFLKFLCDQLSALKDHVSRHPDTKTHKQTTLVMAAVLGGLQICGQIGEERLHILLQTILSGLKCQNVELSSLSSILLGFILPRVNLKEKAVIKLSKALSKYSRDVTTDDSLYLVLLLARTQTITTDNKLFVNLVCKHEATINGIVNQAKYFADEETPEQLDELVYSLTVVADMIVAPMGQPKLVATSEETALLNLISSCTGLLPLSEETAEKLSDTVLCIAKSLHKEDSQLKEFKQALSNIKVNIETFNPSIYHACFMEFGQSDILFVPGSETPTSSEIDVAKIMATDPLINFLSTKLLLKCGDRKTVNKVINKNRGKLEKILKAPTQFLLHQMDQSKLEILMLNLFKATELVPELQKLVLAHLCAKELASTSLQSTLELLILPVLLTCHPEVSKQVLQSSFALSSSLIMMLSTLSPSSSMFARALMQKLSIILDPNYINTVLNTPFLYNYSPLITLLLRLVPLLTVKSNQNWSPSLAKLMTCVVVHLHMSADDVEADDDVSFVAHAKDNDLVQWTLVLNCVSVIDKKENAEEILKLWLCLHEKAKLQQAQDIAKALETSFKGDYLEFLLSQAINASSVKLNYLCLHEADLFLARVSPNQKNNSNHLILFVIFYILNPEAKIQKQAFRLLPKLMSVTEEKCLITFSEFFIENKSEIINNLDNLNNIIKLNKLDTNTICQLFKQSLNCPIAIFVKLAVFFEELTIKSAAEDISRLGLSLLHQGDDYSSENLSNIITRLTNVLVVNFNSQEVKQFMKVCLESTVNIESAGLTYTLSQHLLRCLAISPDLPKMTESQISDLLSLLVDASVGSSCVEAMKVMIVAPPTSNAILDKLNVLWGKEALASKSKKKQEESTLNEEQKWTATCWLLELVGNILEQSQDWTVLIKPMFVLLYKATNMELEEGSYKISLILNDLHNILIRTNDATIKKLDSSQLDPELIVNCIRTNPNPDIRNTALKLLARCAVHNPDFILHNSITIFTFMGSHLMQVDSKRSFQVACEALDVLVPAMKTACESLGRQTSFAGNCLGVLTTFVDASKDIPTHRLVEFMVRLVQCLGQQDYLWVAAILLAKKDRKGGERNVAEILCRFEPCQGIEAMLRLMVNTRNDSQQLRKMFGVQVNRKEDTEKPDDWDMLRLRSLQLTSNILLSNAFKNHVRSQLQGGDRDILEMINLLIEATIMTIQEYTDMTVTMPARLKKNLIAQTEKVLEQSLSLLDGELFLQLAQDLLSSTVSSVRLRALEVVSAKLAPSCTLPVALLDGLLTPVVKLSLTEEHPHAQQLAFLTVRQLAKLVTNTELLTEAAEAFSPSFLKGINNPKVLGVAVISCGDVLAALGPRAVTKVTPMVEWLLSSLEATTVSDDWTEKETAAVRNSFLYCLQKLVEGFIGFLNPLLGRLICLSCRLAGQQDESTAVRAKALLSCLATNVSPHTMLATATSLLQTLWINASSVAPFINFVSENCRRLERNQLTSVSKEIVGLFTVALSYRDKLGNNEDPAIVNSVEQAVISTFLSVALRLSLENFKPVYQRLVNLCQNGNTEQQITMFNLIIRVGEKLKSLFSFGVESTVLLVTSVLSQERPEELVVPTLSSIATVLTYNKLETGVISLAQFERLVTTLLSDWLLPFPVLVTALSQLAASTVDDTNWKFLHYQLLMALRDPRPGVRIHVLEVLEHCVTDRTDTYMPVLPDAVPFLQEILEDDDQAVETKCRDFIQHMETTFGQNIESYFV